TGLACGPRLISEQALCRGATTAAAASAGLLLGESECRPEPEMSLTIDRGISARGFLVESLGQEHRGADVHRLAPELRELLALDADALHPPRIGPHGHP